MSRIQGERVFCHQCQNEWDRAHGGLICPRCEGDFTEILEPGALPSTYDFNHEPSPSASPEPPLPPLEPLRDHNPWADTTRTDDDGNFTTFEFTSNGGSGRMMFSTRMWSPDGRNVRLDDLLDSAVEDVEMEELLTHLVEQQNRGGPLPFSPLGFPGAEAGPGLHGPPPHMQPASLQDLFSLILQSMQPGMMPGQDPDDRRRLGQPPLPFDLLHHMLNPGNARTGDAVYSQEAFDRIMTQLMEQNNAGSAPPPASEDAIRSLKKKRVDREMLGDDGKAECSICMDNVDVGQEVTVLPCNHWFHGESMIRARTAENQSRIPKKDDAPNPRDEEADGHLRYQVLAHTNQRAADTTQFPFQKAPARSGMQDNSTTEEDETTNPIVLNITDIRAARVILGGTAREVIMGEMEAAGVVVETVGVE